MGIIFKKLLGEVEETAEVPFVPENMVENEEVVVV